MKKLFKLKDIMIGVVIGTVLSSGIAYSASENIAVNFLPLKYYFDEVEVKPPVDQQGFVYKGTTYVPLRFAAESLGKKVGYEAKTYSIFIGIQPGKFTHIDKATDTSKQKPSSASTTTDTPITEDHKLSLQIMSIILYGFVEQMKATVLPNGHRYKDDSTVIINEMEAMIVQRVEHYDAMYALGQTKKEVRAYMDAYNHAYDLIHQAVKSRKEEDMWTALDAVSVVSNIHFKLVD